MIPHVPPEHVGVPFAPVQVWPQEPQSDALALMLTSQPSDTLALQSTNPGLQLIEQVPDAHDGVPFVELHEVPQLPQWAGSVPRVVSHPLDTSPSQSPWSVPH